MQAKTWDGHPLASATVVQAQMILHGCLGAAIGDGLINTNPVTPAKLSRRGQVKERRHLTVDQYALLRDATPDRYRIAIVLMAYCGLRWGEIGGLRLRNIDRDRRLLHVVETITEVSGKLASDTPKSAAATRTLPLPEPAYQALLEHLAIQFCGPDDYLLHTHAREPVGYRTFRRFGWDVAINTTGLPHEFTPHGTAPSYVDSWGVAFRPQLRLVGGAVRTLLG